MADDASAEANVSAADPLQAAAEAIGQAELAQASRATAIDSAVSAWVDTDIRNSAISRATDAWNHLAAVLPHLISALKEL